MIFHSDDNFPLWHNCVAAIPAAAGGMHIGTLPVDLNWSNVIEIDAVGCDEAAAEELEPAQEANGGEGNGEGEGFDSSGTSQIDVVMMPMIEVMMQTPQASSGRVINCGA